MCVARLSIIAAASATTSPPFRSKSQDRSVHRSKFVVTPGANAAIPGGAGSRRYRLDGRTKVRQVHTVSGGLERWLRKMLVRAPPLLVHFRDSTHAVNGIPVVVNTNVFVAGLRSGGGASRAVLRRALGGNLQPLFGNALWMEYQDLLDRPVWGDATTSDERQSVLAALALRGRWVTVYYGWRPNLPDEGDNHLIELALAGGAQAIVTHNLRDLRGGELRLGTLRVLTPAQCLEEWE